MELERLDQTCGNCGVTNSADAVICAACGVVLAAYTSPNITAPPDLPPVVDKPEIPSPPAPHRVAPSSSSGDWRTLFEQHSTSPVPEPPIENLRPAQRPLIGDDAAHEATAPARAESPAPSSPASTGTKRAAPAGREQNQTAQPASRRPAPVQRPSSGHVPAAPSVSTSRINPRAASRAFGMQARRPLTIMYAGIALLLGGCVLSLLLAMLFENSSAIGFAFLCTVPVGLVLFVVGFIRMTMRREGRAPK